MPGKLADCSSKDSAPLRAVHRRGRQRRRSGEARAQPGVPGDPADPREDPQRRARPPRPHAEERGDPGAHHRGRHRHRRGVRHRQAPVPQDRADDRRRRRRLAHPHAAAHVLLPAVPRDRARRLRLHRAAAAVPRRHRQGAQLPQGRSRAARVRGRARGPQDRGQPVQGSRRDGLAGARRHHDGSAPRARCCRCRWRRPPSPTTCSRG